MIFKLNPYKITGAFQPFSDFNIHICEKKKKISDIKKEKRELEKKIEDLDNLDEKGNFSKENV